MKYKVQITFRQLLILVCTLVTVVACNEKKTVEAQTPTQPNVLVLLTDQWRAQATGYAGDPNVDTPHLDSLAAISVNFKNAVSGMPVCSPFRASLLTGQRPLTHGVYDTFEQTDAAIDYIVERKSSKNPFMMILSYGTPHAPYHTAPLEYRNRFDPEKIQLRKNVPDSLQERAKKDLAGYYAHIAALDDMIGKVIKNLKESGQFENTIIVFTADHGDLLGSHGAYKKQQPYEESARVPMLYYIPEKLKIAAGEREALMNSEDIMPTLLSLCNIPIPDTVEGLDYRPYMEGKESIGHATLLVCVQPFGQWNKVQHGGREYRAIKTLQYTYARDLNGPWLLFDNINDPYQLFNLVGNEGYTTLQDELEKQLSHRLKETGDEFLPGMEYIKKWGYPVDETGTVPYTN